MTFINERITSDVRTEFDLSRIKKPPLYLDPAEPYKWTIDRSRNIFLVWTHGGSEDEPSAQHFALWWDGEIVHVKLEQWTEGEFSRHVVSTWQLKSLVLPAALESKREQVLLTLKEALRAYRVAGIGVPIASHEANFSF